MPSIHFWKSGNQSNTLHSPSNILHVTFHIQYSMYPVQNSTYPTQNSTYPIQNSTYAIQNSTYPIQNSTYTATHLGGPAALPSQPVQGHESIQLRTQEQVLCTMVCKPSLVVPPQYLWLGVHSRASVPVTVPCVVTRGRMKGRSLLGALIGYSRQRVIQCRKLQPSWRLWIKWMMFSRLLLAS